MRVLVTGGAGYVGSVLVGCLLERGHNVTVMDNLHKGGLGLLPQLFREPSVPVPGVIGFLLLVAFALDVIRGRKVVSFLRGGVVD